MRTTRPCSTWRHAPATLAVAVLSACAAQAPPAAPVTPEPRPSAEPPAAAASGQADAATRQHVSSTVPPSTLASHACPAGAASTQRAVITVEGGVARFEPSTFPVPDEDVPQRVVWQEDLNADGRLDVAVFHDVCGAHGECMYGVYAQCEGGVFVPVFEPEYLSVAPTPIDRRDSGWRRLETAVSFEDPHALVERTEPRELRFEGGRYVLP